MTESGYALFDTAIGRCGIVWGGRGINGVQLPMGSEDKTRSRIRQGYGDIAEAPPWAACDSADPSPLASRASEAAVDIWAREAGAPEGRRRCS